MRLYHSPASPFVRKVMLTLHETNRVADVELIPASGTPTEPGTMPITRNPLGKLPTLERDDGPALYDSRVICRYLDDLSGGGLYPEKPRLWDTLTLEATGDGIAEAAVLMVYEVRTRPEERRHPAWVEAQWAKITRALDSLEDRWLAHLAGPFDIGHIAVGSALGYLDFRHPDRNWRAGRDGLAAWTAAFDERPASAATKPV